MNPLPFHPVADLFPLIEGDEYRDLKRDIQEHGQREPIWTVEGKIIDGRNRYRACLDLGIEPQLRPWSGQGSLVAFVVSLNLRRRHLTSSQRAAVAVELLPLLEAEAKERQRRHGDTAPGRQPEKTLRQKVAEVSDPDAGKASQRAAKIAGTNRHYVNQAKKIKEASPERFEEIRRGKASIPTVHQELAEVRRRKREKKRERLEFLRRQRDAQDRRAEFGPAPTIPEHTENQWQLAGLDEAELAVLLEELTRSAQWYESLVARLKTDYDYTIPRMAHWAAQAIWKLRERLTYDREQLQHAVYGLRELLTRGPTPGKEVRAWAKKAGISRGLLALARKIVGVVIHGGGGGAPDQWYLEGRQEEQGADA